MGSIGHGQKAQAKALINTIESVIAEAEKNKDEARRNGTPPRKMGIFVPKGVTIRYDLLRRLKDAGVVISDKPISCL